MVKYLIHAEYGIGFLAILYLYVSLGFSQWVFWTLLLTPDITILGYFINARLGARIYNCGHTFIFPILLGICYLIVEEKALLMFFLIWIAHISIDRFFGFGLKYKDSFNRTHLQKL